MDTNQIVEDLRNEVEQKSVLDVGHGAEDHYGVSRYKLTKALNMLKAEGYELIAVLVSQRNSEVRAAFKVLTKPGITYGSLVKNPEQIKKLG